METVIRFCIVLALASIEQLVEGLSMLYNPGKEALTGCGFVGEGLSPVQTISFTGSFVTVSLSFVVSFSRMTPFLAV